MSSARPSSSLRAQLALPRPAIRGKRRRCCLRQSSGPAFDRSAPRMALQRSPSHDNSDDQRAALPKGKGARGWLRSIVTPEAGPVGERGIGPGRDADRIPDGTQDGTQDGTPHGLPYGNPSGNQYGNPSGNPHGNPDGHPSGHPHEHPPGNLSGNPQGVHFQRVGDTIVLGESAVPAPP